MKTIITSLRLLTLPLALTLCSVLALVVVKTVSSEAPKNIRGKSDESVRSFDIGLGPHTFIFQLGRDAQSRYLGSPALQQTLESAQAQPKSMISNDLNGDSMGDLVIGYANNGGGVLGVRQGNLQAISPTDPSVFQGITQGRYPSPFLPEVKLYELPEAPDFLQFGDFNSDGYSDVMTAARGSQRMYLLAGNGGGDLVAPQLIEVPGVLTEMQAATEQLGTFTQLALGLFASGGSQLAVYNKTEDLARGPESYPMSGEVTSIAFDQLDGDGITDLAAAASTEVLVVHGRSLQPPATGNGGGKSQWELATAPAALIERHNVPFAIRALATGNFTFDRNHQREIALLSDDGTVHLSARGNPDTRPFTREEKETIGKLRRSYLHDKIDMATLTAETNKLIRPNVETSWRVAQTIKGTSAYTGSGQAVFQRSNGASQSLDELLIGDGINNTVQTVSNELELAKLESGKTTQSIASQEVSVSGSPIAAVSMRLSVNLQPGTVVLGSNMMEPNVGIITPTANFTVNSTADLPDSNTTNAVCMASNGLCTLRAAIMQSNHTGGSNSITVPDGTYTLTLGPPDDEALTGGATEQSGDLDIFSWDLFDGSPILTAVSITGGTRDGCIIQMGPLSPTLATNTPNNKERILEVNDVAVVGFHRRIAVTLTNLTMQNGYSPTSSGSFLEGGAIYYDGSAQDNTNIGLLTLTNVRLQANTSAGQGGGVWAGFGSLAVNTTSIVRANLATNQSTGGVAWTGGNTVETQFLNITNSTIGGALVADGNTATDPTFGAPGGVDARGGLSVTISGSTIQNNVANVTAGTIGGGGIQINSPTVAISNTTISSNKAKHNAGGMFVSSRNAVTNASSTTTLTTVNVTGNQADSDNTGGGDGGGIFNYFGSLIIQTTSHVDGNSAFNGGGISNSWTGVSAPIPDPAAGLTVQSGSTVGQVGAGNGNSARNNGGSLYFNAAGAPSFNPINLNNLTFANSVADSDNAGGGDGGAIFMAAGAISSLNTCTFDGNTVGPGGTGDAIRQTGGTIAGAGTLNFNNGETISISGGTFTSTSGTLNLTGNLLFTGGTFTHNSGTWVMNGSSAQTIGTSPITFFNLTINNGAGVTLNGTGTVAGTLALTNGVFGIGTNTLNLTGPVSFTSGSINSSATGTVNYTQAAANQNVAPGNYGNLFFNNSVKVLPNGSTVNIAGLFTPGTAAPTITGSTVNFNGAGAQTVPAINYNNLTISGNRGGANVTLASGTIGVAGTFNPSATNLAYVKTGNTFDFNGAGAQTVPAFDFNNLTSSNTGARTLANAGTIGIAGAFTPGTNVYTVTGSTINFNGTGAQTIPAFAYNNLTSSSSGGRTLANSGTIGIAEAFTPGANVYTITGSTIDFNGAGGQTIPAFNYNNLTSSNTGARTLANAGTIGIAGAFTQGTNAYTITGSTINFNGTGAQTIPAFAYNNLTSSSSGGRTLANSGTIGIAGAFTPGANVYTITGSTIDFNGAGGQTIPAFNYNNLTSSNTGARTLANAGTIGIAGAFTQGTNAYTITGSTINFNGTGAQTIPAFAYNNLTSSSSGGRTLANSGTIGIAGAFTPGANVYTITGSTIDFNGAGGQTIPAFNYNNLTSSNTGARTLANAGTIGIAGAFTQGTNAYTITGSTINFNGAGAQTIPGFTYNNLTSGGGGQARTLDPVNTIRIAGVFTPGSDIYTITGSTIEYNGTAAQSLPGGFLTYNNVTFNNPTTVTGGPATLDINGNVTITQGTFAAGGALSITVGGNWTNNGGAFSPSTGDVTFDGGVGQTIGGTTATTFNHLSVGNASGLAMSHDNTVNGNLALVGSDITVAATKTLTQPVGGSSSGAFDVNGRVQRTGLVTGACPAAPCANTRSFGNPLNQITITAGTAPTSIVVDLARTAPATYAAAVQRNYTITPTGGAFTNATVRLRYLDSELNGNVEANLLLRRFITSWSAVLPSVVDTTNNWVECNAVTQFSQWTFDDLAPTASEGTIMGRIVDGNGAPVEGAVVRLSGAQNRKFITDANGNYRFDNVETGGFYNVTPSRVNYTFSPAVISFSQQGATTEAAFGATATGSTVNPLDTPEYFVRQNYLDFLGREPDESGFNFWTDQILACGENPGDAGCVDIKRMHVSAAYFLSIEFQETGGLVDGLYRASFGRRPGYAEFRPDAAAVAPTLVVGAEGWQGTLESGKAAFINSFVQRAGFQSVYGSLSNAAYVDALIANTGVSFTSAERNALVSGLGNGMTRADVLRAIVEDADFAAAKRNGAFVMMEYFGYLRREPDAEGFDYWLNKLNQFNGNFEQAEMVRAFIISSEYRQRFPK